MKSNIKNLILILFFLNNSFKIFSKSKIQLVDDYYQKLFLRKKQKKTIKKYKNKKSHIRLPIKQQKKTKAYKIIPLLFLCIIAICLILGIKNFIPFISFIKKHTISTLSDNKNVEKKRLNNIINEFDKDIFEDLLYLKENNFELFKEKMNYYTDIWISLIKIIDTTIKLSTIKKLKKQKEIIDIIPEFKNLDLSKKEKIMEFIGMFLSKNIDIFESNESKITIFNFLETNDMTHTLNIISTISDYNILIPLGKIIKLQLNNLDNTVKNRYIDLFKNLLPLCFIADSFANDILIDQSILQLYPTKKDKEKYVAIHNAQFKESLDLFNLTFKDLTFKKFFELKQKNGFLVRALKSPVYLQDNQIKKIRSYEDFKKFNNN